MIKFTITEDEADKSLEKVVRTRLHYATLGEIFKVFRKKDVKLDGKRSSKGKEICEEGMEVLIYLDEQRLRNEAMKRDVDDGKDFFTDNFIIAHETKEILICDKPIGVPVQPGKGIKKGHSLIEMAVKYSNESAKQSFNPHLVHRIDSDTSGLIIIAKNEYILKEMLSLFELGRIKKQYTALCHGNFKEKSGTITDKLFRTTSKSKGMMIEVDNKKGLEAHTEYKVVQQFNGYSLLSVTIKTGRTHQIRVHFSNLGHPLIGDKRYGDSELDAKLFDSKKLTNRLYLHASLVGFRTQSTKKRQQFVSPLPKEFPKKTRR